ELARNSMRCLIEAAADPSAVEAAALMLDFCFRADKLEEAVPYARCVVEHQGNAPAGFPGWSRFVAGAHFVLARTALAVTPPRVEDALDHLRQSEQAAEETNSSAGPAAPRWRVLGMELAALKAKADLTPGAEAAADTLRVLRQERLPPALDRLR